jgi:hypothetical protein
LQTDGDAPDRSILQVAENGLEPAVIVIVMVTTLEPLNVSTECVVPVTDCDPN